MRKDHDDLIAIEAFETELNEINTVSYDGILIMDENWRITSLNQRGENLLKAYAADYINAHIADKLLLLNTQKEPLDFTRLKSHFECGNNYVCNRGVIVNLGNKNAEVFSSFTIAPYYTNDVLNSYVLIFRDITQEVTRETERMLSHIKGLSTIKNKEQEFITCAKEILCNNHNGALAAELHHYVSSQTNQLLERYILSHAVQSNIDTLNQFVITSSKNNNHLLSFFIGDHLADIIRSASEFGLPHQLDIDNQIKKPIQGDAYVFEQLIYEIIAANRSIFKSANIIQLGFRPLESTKSFRPWIIAEVKLKTAYVFTQQAISDNLLKIREQLTSEFLDTILIDYDNSDIRIQFNLKFPILENEAPSLTQVVNQLRCMFYLDDNSTLMSQFEHSFLLNQLNYLEVNSADDAVKYIKEGRLNNTEFNIIVSDKKDYALLEREVLNEITSYINQSFLGLIYISDQPPASPALHNLAVYNIKTAPDILELRSVMNLLRAKYLQKTQESTQITDQLPKYNKDILFINLEGYSNLLYLQVFEELGFNVFQASPEQVQDQLVTRTFDAIFINMDHKIKPLGSLLTDIQNLFTEVPVFVFTAPLQESELAQLVTHKIEHFMIKPFSISELLLVLQTKFT